MMNPPAQEADSRKSVGKLLVGTRTTGPLDHWANFQKQKQLEEFEIIRLIIRLHEH